MSIFAGVIARRHAPIPAEIKTILRQSLSRNPGHTVTEHRAVGAYLCKVDIGAFGRPAMERSAGGSVTIAAGHPLFSDVRGQRDVHVRALHDAAEKGDWTILDSARGTYCAAIYSVVDRSITLVGDKLGARPIYYFANDDFVLFATALRILEGVPAVPKVMNLRGIAELIAYGHTLGRRTPYADISVLHSGEVVRVDATSVRLRTYWAWDQCVAARAHLRETPQRLHELFVNAVRDRLEDDRRTIAFLSGGLDSRTIVATLRGLDIGVRSCSFFRSVSTQEAVLAGYVAAALGCDHQSFPLSDYGADWKQPTFRLLASIGAADATIERPKLAWSGDGGSVGAGFVYVDEDILAATRDGNDRRAIEILIGRFGSSLSRRLFTPAVGDEIVRLPLEGAMAELAALPAVEPARRFHLFLMVNNQRQHLVDHFEDLDLRDLDLHLPFFDAEFLSALFTVPVDDSVRHILYHEMLQELIPVARSLPWQTYPRHLPCPLPLPPGLSGQWDDTAIKSVARAARARQLDSLRRIAFSRDFPRSVLSRPTLVAYLAAYRAGVSDYGWVTTIAETVQQYWSRGARSYIIPSLEAPGQL